MNYKPPVPRAEMFLDEAREAMTEARLEFEAARVRLSECEELVRALSLLQEARRGKDKEK